MPRVGFYDPYLETAGGGEKYLLTILEAAATYPGAEIVVLSPTPPEPAAWRRLGVRIDPAGLTWRSAQPPGVTLATRGLDLLVALHNHIPPLSLAARSVAISQFPSRRPRPVATPGGLMDRLRLRSYDTWVCYSSFVQGHLRERLGVEAVVLPPPIDVGAPPPGEPKAPEIVAVGRFFAPGRTWNSKKHDVLIEAFRQLRGRAGHDDWQLHLAGGCDDSEPARRYVEGLRSLATGLPVEFHVNVERAELEGLYRRASLFWHAAGLGETEPDRQEHFGMTTVEAMAFGCVPIVPALGGQTEIVDDGSDGFLYLTPKELVDQSARLIADPARLSAVAAAAHAKAVTFSRERFLSVAADVVLSPTLTRAS